MIRTFLDSSILIAAWKAAPALRKRARAALRDPGRHFVYTDFVELETIPKAAHFMYREEVVLYQDALSRAEKASVAIESIVAQAKYVATKDGLGAFDALHVAAAELERCDELLTAETADKAMFRATSVRIVTIAAE